MKKAKEGEFLIESYVPDYEHDGDCESWESEIDDVLKEAGVNGVYTSWYTDYDYEDGDQGYVTIRGPKAMEQKVRDALEEVGY